MLMKLVNMSAALAISRAGRCSLEGCSNMSSKARRVASRRAAVEALRSRADKAMKPRAPLLAWPRLKREHVERVAAAPTSLMREILRDLFHPRRRVRKGAIAIEKFSIFGGKPTLSDCGNLV
jgi:hypothetical protein